MRDTRRLEVVADGLSLFGGAHLAGLFLGDGMAKRGAASRNEFSLTAARQRMELTYPELSGEGGRARSVVLTAEVGEKW